MSYKKGVAHASRQVVVELLMTNAQWINTEATAEAKIHSDHFAEVLLELVHNLVDNITTKDGEADTVDLRTVFVESILLNLGFADILIKISNMINNENIERNRIIPVLDMQSVLEGLSLGVEIFGMGDAFEDILKEESN